MKKLLTALTEDAKQDILDAEILIPVLVEISDTLTSLEARIAALETAE